MPSQANALEPLAASPAQPAVVPAAAAEAGLRGAAERRKLGRMRGAPLCGRCLRGARSAAAAVLSGACIAVAPKVAHARALLKVGERTAACRTPRDSA